MNTKMPIKPRQYISRAPIPEHLLWDMLRDGMFLPTSFWVEKRRPSICGNKRCCALYNDGEHLYPKDLDGGLTLLRFAVFWQPQYALEVPGFSSPECIYLRTLGHTLQGNVIVVLFAYGRNWTVTLSVRRGFTAYIYDLGSHLLVHYKKETVVIRGIIPQFVLAL